MKLWARVWCLVFLTHSVVCPSEPPYRVYYSFNNINVIMLALTGFATYAYNKKTTKYLLTLSQQFNKLTYYSLLHHTNVNKKLSYRRGTAWCVVSIEILPIATQQCRNYLYDTRRDRSRGKRDEVTACEPEVVSRERTWPPQPVVQPSRVTGRPFGTKYDNVDQNKAKKGRSRGR